MKGYTHQGMVKPDGLVDRSQSIADPSKLNVSPVQDGFHLVDPEPGDFEWWYFDVIDATAGYILKLVAHLGTDPLRRRFYPQIAVSVRTPTRRQTFIRPHSLHDFRGSRDWCDISIKDEFRALVEPSGHENRYRVSVHINGFRAEVIFIPQIEGWKPLGDAVNITRGRKKGTFSWVIPLPKAKVEGEFSIGKENYELSEALGYHDHNYWNAGGREKLFMDSAVSQWYWGRFLSHGYTVIFMETHLRGHPIQSLLIADQETIIHSSNNLVEVMAEEMEEDPEIKTPYPSRITITSVEEGNPFQMTLRSKEIIDKRDLLEGINPFVGWLIKRLVSRPAYYGILADSFIKIAGKEIRGMGVYELMYFRRR